jgi:hypothetical protein
MSIQHCRLLHKFRAFFRLSPGLLLLSRKSRKSSLHTTPEQPSVADGGVI